jgi:hypothetical protein
VRLIPQEDYPIVQLNPPQRSYEDLAASAQRPGYGIAQDALLRAAQKSAPRELLCLPRLVRDA